MLRKANFAHLIVVSVLMAAGITIARCSPNGPAVVVELFTSEGCSDCPPAEEVLAGLEKQTFSNGAHVIALEEHVDYFNSPRWTDRFSSAQFTSRQAKYADYSHDGNGVYTPGMLVNGMSEFVGSDRTVARDSIDRASTSPTVPVDIELTKLSENAVNLSLNVGALPAALGSQTPNDLLVAITEDNLYSHVTGGENSGHTLHHVAVVRRLQTVGTVSGSRRSFDASVPLDRSWNRSRLKVVAFVQQRENGHIVGAAEKSLM